MGSKSNRAVSWKSENQDVMGIALSKTIQIIKWISVVFLKLGNIIDCYIRVS